MPTHGRGASGQFLPRHGHVAGSTWRKNSRLGVTETFPQHKPPKVTPLQPLRTGPETKTPGNKPPQEQEPQKNHCTEGAGLGEQSLGNNPDATAGKQFIGQHTKDSATGNTKWPADSMRTASRRTRFNETRFNETRPNDDDVIYISAPFESTSHRPAIPSIGLDPTRVLFRTSDPGQCDDTNGVWWTPSPLHQTLIHGMPRAHLPHTSRTRMTNPRPWGARRSVMRSRSRRECRT